MSAAALAELVRSSAATDARTFSLIFLPTQTRARYEIERVLACYRVKSTFSCMRYARAHRMH